MKFKKAVYERMRFLISRGIAYALKCAGCFLLFKYGVKGGMVSKKMGNLVLLQNETMKKSK